MKIGKRRALFSLYSLVVVLFAVAAFGIDAAITTYAENNPILNQRTVIIDPGHGGEDGGAISCSGVTESAINLEIALKLDDLLHLLGINTIMTRTTDISIYTKGETLAAKKVSDLKERVRIVNNTEDAILISIHQNTFPDSQYYGAQVFYAHTSDSEKIASELQSTLVSALNKGSNRKIKRSDGIYIMDKIKCPAVLLECGFLSNAGEEKLLRNDEYQKKLSCVIGSVCSRYLGGNCMVT